MNPTRYLVILLTVFTLSISGCALFETKNLDDDDDFDLPLSLDLDEAMVAWYESLARINFVGGVPARSDIEVGEIYLTWNYNKAVGVEKRLRRMVRRQRWAGSIVPDEVAGRQTELDLVDLPFIAVGSRESSDLIEIVPSNIISEKGTFRMRPTTGFVESQPLVDILGWLQDDESSDIGAMVLKKEYWRNLVAMSTGEAEPVWLHVVNEILYMQSMDIELKGEHELDIPEDVEATVVADEDPEESADSGEQDTETQDGQVTVQADTDEDEEIIVTQETNAFTRALAINEILDAQGLDNNVGIVTDLLYIDDDQVVLRTVLPRPVAIGVRGLRLRVDPLTGEVSRVEAWQP